MSQITVQRYGNELCQNFLQWLKQPTMQLTVSDVYHLAHYIIIYHIYIISVYCWYALLDAPKYNINKDLQW